MPTPAVSESFGDLLDIRFHDIFDNEIDRRDRTERVSSMTGNLMQGLSNAEAAVTR